MSIQFFNFGNDETFHFFRWVSESGQVDPGTLIATAYEQADAPDDEHFDADVICIVVRDKLANLLEEVITESAPDCFQLDAHEIGDVMTPPSPERNANGLLLPSWGSPLGGLIAKPLPRRC